ncbi:MAG TPA: two pore domain potassium channel family protein [Sphingomicrobium sp.]|nr:two pore domain potassium channel family protein [Sphingomicrobium sp.]
MTQPLQTSAPELGLQVAASAVLVVVMVVIHSVALIEVSRRLHLREEELEDRNFDYSAVMLMARLGLLLFVLHLFEILVFAGFYMAVGAVAYFEAAFYYSASVYATLGTTEDFFAEGWRLVGAIEAVVGFILIGWSTAFMVTTVNRLRG